jgi:hypothetical protein
MKWFVVSLGFSVPSVVKPFRTNGKSFDTENTEKAKPRNLRVSSCQLEECRKMGDRELFRARIRG